MRYTPENITELGQDDIFVFGSNPEGRHITGAAKVAKEKFGAVMGQSVGLQGQSYAIPTMRESIEDIRRYVDGFLDVAYECDQNTFYVTRIGCGTAGYTDEEIAPLFDRALDMYNVCLPESFVKIIERNRNKAFVPVKTTRRHLFPDALRGFALLGICLANYPEFSLYTFQPGHVVKSYPEAGLDSVVKFLQYVFIDGKFYTLFSLLFGIGFSIIISHASERGADGFRIFYRRMAILALIGCTHLMLIWSGDILLLYALLGMLLPLFRNVSDKKIITIGVSLMLLPVVIDTACEITGVFPGKYPYEKWWQYAGRYGITEENFGTWLRDARSYREVLYFLIQGAWERMYEFVDGNRYFKVLGLFLIGFVAGRHKIYANLSSHRRLFVKAAVWGFSVGLPLSVLYAISGVNSHPWGMGVHSMIYTLSVYPLGFGYAGLLGVLCMRHSGLRIWKWIAAPGRMALTNYIGQSLIGIFLFYGIGLGFGASIGLARTELVAVGVFVFQIVFSQAWLSVFQYGPLEWIWRMLTYGKWLNIVR